jgi:hypothetical protein
MFLHFATYFTNIHVHLLPCYMLYDFRLMMTFGHFQANFKNRYSFYNKMTVLLIELFLIDFRNKLHESATSKKFQK